MGKDKNKDKDGDGDAEAQPPNFYCRRNPTIPRQHQPRPYAFLQRILSEHRIRTDDTDYVRVEEISSSINGVSVTDPSDSIAVQAGSGAIAAVQNGLNLRETANTLAETSPSSSPTDSNAQGNRNAEAAHGSSTNGAPSEAAEEKQEQEELPWFSQLSAYPQLRSAGVPLIPDDGPSNKMAVLNAAATKKRTNTALATASIANLSSGSRQGSSSSTSSALLGTTSAPLSRVTSPKTSSAATMEAMPRSGSPALLQDALARAQRANGGSAIPLTSTLSSTGSVASSNNDYASRETRLAGTSGLANAIPMSATTTATGSVASGPSGSRTNTNALSGLAMPGGSTNASTNPAPDFQEDLLPPDNFAMVNSHVYRSSFPKKKHFPFLRTLGLRSVLTLILEEYPETNSTFLDQNGITFFQFGIPGNKEPFVSIPDDKITAALTTILDRRNHPILIHCNKGKHRTGCLIGCLRKLQQWSLTTIFDEYRRFSWPKSRSMDQEFIELYDERAVSRDIDVKWLPKWSVLPLASLNLHNRASRLENKQEQDDEEAEEVGGDEDTIWRGM